VKQQAQGIHDCHVPEYRRAMSGVSMERRATALIGQCYVRLDADGLREEILRRLRRMIR
jgi:hypothetical protein